MIDIQIIDILKRIGEISNDLQSLSKINPETSNIKTEVECALGAYIKSLQIQLKKITAT